MFNFFKKPSYGDEGNLLILRSEIVMDYIHFANYAWEHDDEDRYYYCPTPNFMQACYKFYRGECFRHNIEDYQEEDWDCDNRAYEFVRDCSVRFRNRFHHDPIGADIAVWRLGYKVERTGNLHIVNISLWNIGGKPMYRITEPGDMEVLRIINLTSMEFDSIKRGYMRR